MSKPLTRKELAALNKKIKEEMQAEREFQKKMTEKLKKDLVEMEGK